MHEVHGVISITCAHNYFHKSKYGFLVVLNCIGRIISTACFGRLHPTVVEPRLAHLVRLHVWAAPTKTRHFRREAK
jgi:hypothetical protein